MEDLTKFYVGKLVPIFGKGKCGQEKSLTFKGQEDLCH